MVTIDELNLASVTVNGEEVTVTDGKFTLKPDDGKQTIIAADKAGNTGTVTVTVNEKMADKSDTGDTGMMLGMVLLLVACGALAVMTYSRKKKQEE